MHKKLSTMKGLAIAITITLIGMCTVSVSGEVETEEYINHSLSNSIEPSNFEPECYPTFMGEKGEDGWFLSDVFVMFTFQPERVKNIWYRITTQEWINYSKQPFYFRKEGDYPFEYKWEDFHGNISFPATGETIKIDKTLPSITLKSKVGGLFKKNKITFTANVNDGDIGSGIEKVEFYVDSELVETVKVSPYVYVYKDGVEGLLVTAIAYDHAGLSTNDNSTTDSVGFTKIYFGKFLQGLAYLNQIIIQLLKIISSIRC